MKRIALFLVMIIALIGKASAQDTDLQGYAPKVNGFGNYWNQIRADVVHIPHRYGLIRNTTDSTPQLFVWSTGSGDSLVVFVNGRYIIVGGMGGGTTYSADGTTLQLTGTTFGIHPSYIGQSSITRVGTITTGVWNSTPVTDPYIASSATWNAKLTSVLNSANIFVGNGSNIATAVTPSGDLTMNNAGVFTLATTITAGSCTNCNLTFDAKGRLLSATNGSGGGGGNPFADNTPLIKNNADNTRLVTFDASGVSTGTTRTLTVPDANGTIVLHSNIQTLTNKTINASSNSISNITNGNLSGSAGITNGNLASMAGHTYKGNNTGSAATPSDVTTTQLTADLNPFTTSLQGLVPSPGGTASGRVLQDDGAWHVPSAGGSDSGIVEGPFIKVDRVASNYRRVRMDTVQTDARYVAKSNTDVYRFPPIYQVYPAAGIVATGTTVTNYGIAQLDSTSLPFTTANYLPLGGTKYGGILYSTTIGTDSFQVQAPYISLMGSSYMEGHTGNGFARHGRLHPGGSAVFQWNYPDSTGQISYTLRQLTNMRVYNHGIGGERSDQTRARWGRDGGAMSISNLDGRGSFTISKLPYCIIYDGVGNDPYGGSMTPELSIANLKWMAAWCRQRHILFVCFNSPAGAQASKAGKDYLNRVNAFLAAGGLDEWGAIVFDMVKFWSDPAWGYDGIHGNPGYISTDGTHLNATGYDSLAKMIYRTCRIPKLTKLIMSTRAAPSSPVSNLAYISAFNIAGVAYTTSKAVDTIDITTPLVDTRVAYDAGDSVWIKPTAKATISGTGANWGVDFMGWVLDNTNNFTDTSYYTRKTMGSNGATSTDPSVSTLEIIGEQTNGGNKLLAIREANAALNSCAFCVIPSSPDQIMINMGTTSTRISSSVVSIGGSGNAIGTAGSINATGLASIIGNEQIGNNTSPNSVGNGFGFYSGSQVFEGNNTSGNSLFIHRKWGGSGTTGNMNATGDDANFAVDDLQAHIGTLFGNRDTISGLKWKPTINITSWGQPGIINYLHFNPNVISLGNQKLNALDLHRGENRLNALPGSPEGTVVGDSVRSGSAIFDVKDSTRGFIVPRLTSAQIAKIGYIKSVNITAAGSGYSNPVTITVSGGSGSGAQLAAWVSPLQIRVINGGKGYGTTTPPTLTITGGGTGATATAVLSGPDSGLLVYNTTIEALQVADGHGGWTTLGASTSGHGTLAIINDADYTVGSGVENVIYQATLTANRTVTLPAASSNTNRVIRVCLKGPGSNQLIISSSSQIFMTGTSSSTSQVTNVIGYVMDFQSDGTSWYLTGTPKF